MQNEKPLDVDPIIRISLIAALVYWSFLLAEPFIGILVWGFILAVALHPIYLWINKWLGDQPTLSAILLTMLSLFIIVGSVVVLTDNMIANINDLAGKIRSDGQIIPEPPAFIKDWPVIGPDLHATWSMANSNLGAILSKYSVYLLDFTKILLTKTANISLSFLLFIVSILFSGYILTFSSKASPTIQKLAKRLSPERGTILVSIMKETIQNISRGVIGLSFLQTLILGILLLIAKMPGAGLVTFLAFILCIAQLGQFIIIIPIIIWLFMTKTFTFAAVISVLLVIDGSLDNFLKPFILARGLRTPTLVIFLGVIGGILTHGVVGIFIGPVVLAIFYDVINHWLFPSPRQAAN